MTSINQWWRAGARQQTALAGCEGMSVRHPRTRPMSFVNGNRAPCGGPPGAFVIIEHREPTLFSAHPDCRNHSHCPRLTISSGRMRRNCKRRTNCARPKKLPGMNENKFKTLNYPVMIFLANCLKIMNFVSR
jgi:hypothetical protein